MKQKYVLISTLLIVLVGTLIGLSLFNNSFAIDTINSNLPTKEFTSNLTNYNSYNLIANSLKGKTEYDDFVDNFNTAINFTTQEGTPLYSLMKNFDFPTVNETFELIEQNPKNITDKGLIYIMSHGYNLINITNNIFTKNTHGSVVDNNIKQYITQIAIWLYIFENKDNFPDYCLQTNIDSSITSCDFYNKTSNKVMTESSVRGIITQASNNKDFEYLGYIIELVNDAEAYVEEDSSLNEISTSSLSYTFYDNYIISSLINPKPKTNKDNFISYSIEIEDLENYGIYIVNKDNQKIDNLNGLNQEFKIYIPLKQDLSTMDLTKVKITIKGTFIENKGYEYRITKSSAGDIIDKKKQKFANEMLAYIPLTEINIDFNLKNFTKISKVDITSKKELPGAKLVINNKDTNSKVSEWTSSDKPHYLFLENGNYELCETIPPDKYELQTECIDFKVEKEKITTQVMENKLMDIPDTNASQNIIAILIGSILFASGCGIIFYSFKVKKISD